MQRAKSKYMWRSMRESKKKCVETTNSANAGKSWNNRFSIEMKGKQTFVKITFYVACIDVLVLKTATIINHLPRTHEIKCWNSNGFEAFVCLRAILLVWLALIGPAGWITWLAAVKARRLIVSLTWRSAIFSLRLAKRSAKH